MKIGIKQLPKTPEPIYNVHSPVVIFFYHIYTVFLSFFKLQTKSYLTLMPFKITCVMLLIISRNMKAEVSHLQRLQKQLFQWPLYNNKMAKKSYVQIRCGKRRYRLCLDDIQDVLTVPRKKRPSIPRFECPTADQSSNSVGAQSEIS